MEPALIVIRRWLAPALIVAAAVFLLDRYCFVPLQCNRIRTQISLRNDIAAKHVESLRIAPLLRQNIAEGSRCLEKSPQDYFLRIELANSYLFVRRYDEAAALLEEGLRYDRRPEIFIGIGKAKIASGHRAEGIEALMEAGRFLRNEPQLNDLLQDVAERDVVLAQLRREFEKQTPR